MTPHNLTKEDGPADLPGVTSIRIGAAWDTSTGMSGGWLGRLKERIGSDLDLIGIAKAGSTPVRYIGIDNLDPLRGSVVHSGDNTTGRGEGDDETIDVDFSKVPPNITSIDFVVAAFKPGSSFDRAKNVDFNIYDTTGGQPGLVATTMPSLQGNSNIHKILHAFRDGQEWKIEVQEKKGTIRQGSTEELLRFAIR